MIIIKLRPLPFNSDGITSRIIHYLHRRRKIHTHMNIPIKGTTIPTILATNLIKSYFEKGLIDDARKLFDEMPERDVVAWTTMISGYTSCNHHVYAWNVFSDMVKDSVFPNAFTLSNVLKVCKCLNCVSCGGLVHGVAVKLGLDGSSYVGNALMDFYAASSCKMDDACAVFRDIEEKTEVAWTTLIAGYTHRGDGYSGLHVFKEMLKEGVEWNPYTVSIAARACATIGKLSLGEQIHAGVVKTGLGSNLPVMNSILDMYCRCGCLFEANRCFSGMNQKDLISWNTLIAGYERVDSSSESLRVFFQMQVEGFVPNRFTLSSVTAASASLAILNFGQQVHGSIIQRGFERNLELENALIDMYAKCGSIADAWKTFSEMTVKNLVSWTSMMIGYGAHGYGNEAIKLFDEMLRSGIKPDRIVFVAVISACSHAGLVDEGLRYFQSMKRVYNVIADQEIYGCVVDLLGRAGRIEEAHKLIETMPYEADESIWSALLGACRARKVPGLGKLAAERVLDKKPDTVEAYVMLSSIYADEGEWSEFAKFRKVIKGMGSRKKAGRSWIEVRNEVYSFVVGQKVGSDIDRVYGVLELLFVHMKEVGYGLDVDCLMYDLEDEEDS